MIVPDMETKIDSHTAGLGIGFLPAPIARDAIANRGLVELLTVTIYRPPSPLAFAWRLSGAGKINEHLRQLFQCRDPLVLPFLQRMSSFGDEISNRGEARGTGSSPDDTIITLDALQGRKLD